MPTKPRRDALRTVEDEAAEILAHRPTRARRARPWDQRHAGELRAYRGIPDDVHAQLVALADRLQVPVGEVARKLFEAGLELCERGEITFEARLVEGRYTLYPAAQAKGRNSR